jgi:tetratricopeptide (TPR) repeat protein
MENRNPVPALAADALLAQARAGGPGAALAAKRAAILAERRRPALAREALLLAVRLDPGDSDSSLDLARLHAEAGDLDSARAEAERVAREAIDLTARARAQYLLGEMARLVGEDEPARAHFTQVLQIEDRFLAANRNDPAAARWYARARGRIAELDALAGAAVRAQSGAEGALALLRACAAQIGEPPVLAADIADAELRLAGFELERGAPASARRRLSEAIGRYEALAVTEKEEPRWRAALADAWTLAAEAEFARAAPESAREAIDKALQARLRLAARHPEEAWALAGTWRVRAALLAALGDGDAAADSHAQARALAAKLRAPKPEAEAPARFHLHTLIDQADQALRGGDLALALDAANAARALAEHFAAKSAPGWAALAAAGWDRLGEVARLAGDASKTLDGFARAVAFRRRELEAEPGDPRAQRGLAAALVRQGEAALGAAKNTQARGLFEESVVLRVRLSEAEPDNPRATHALAAALERLGLAALAASDTGAARRAWERELALAERLYPDAGDPEGARFGAVVHAHLAGLPGPSQARHRAEALRCFARCAQARPLTQEEAALRDRLALG